MPALYSRGFTLLDALVTLSLIGAISSVVLAHLNQAQERTYEVIAKQQMRNFRTALEVYRSERGQYPEEVHRDVPAGIAQYHSGSSTLPTPPWPGSLYDWDHWQHPTTGADIYQLSIRFCPKNQPRQCRFPDTPWAENFDYYSSVYWCLEGPCRAHISKPANHPGYCLNC